MSERCRREYERRHELEVSKLVEARNRKHLERQRKAGELFKLRNGTDSDKCSKCSSGAIFHLTPDSHYYGEMVCSTCGIHIRWVSSSKSGVNTEAYIPLFDFKTSES